MGWVWQAKHRRTHLANGDATARRDAVQDVASAGQGQLKATVMYHYRRAATAAAARAHDFRRGADGVGRGNPLRGRTAYRPPSERFLEQDGPGTSLGPCPLPSTSLRWTLAPRQA